MVSVGSSVILELVLAVHSYHLIAYPGNESATREAQLVSMGIPTLCLYNKSNINIAQR